MNAIVASTFYDPAALSGSQADRITALLDAKNIVIDGQTQNDWDAVFQQAAAFLSPEQLEGFQSGVEFYLASVKMGAISASMRK